MSYSFPVEEVIQELRARVISLWDINSGVPEAGVNSFMIQSTENLPIAVLELDRELTIQEGSEVNMAAKDLVYTFTYYIWYIQATNQMNDDIKDVEDILSDLASNLYADRTMGGLVTNLSEVAFDTSGAGREWPFDPSGVGLQAGYIATQFMIADQ